MNHLFGGVNRVLKPPAAPPGPLIFIMAAGPLDGADHWGRTKPGTGPGCRNRGRERSGTGRRNGGKRPGRGRYQAGSGICRSARRRPSEARHGRTDKGSLRAGAPGPPATEPQPRSGGTAGAGRNAEKTRLHTPSWRRAISRRARRTGWPGRKMYPRRSWTRCMPCFTRRRIRSSPCAI